MLSTKNIQVTEADYYSDHKVSYTTPMYILKVDEELFEQVEAEQSITTSPSKSFPTGVSVNDAASVSQVCPLFINSIVSKFTTPEEQLMALFSTVVYAGALMPYVKINYANKTNYPALMLLVIFPPASGKGGLSLIRTLGNKINAELIQEYQQALIQYKIDEKVYQQALKSGSIVNPPVEPKQVLFLAPADATTARLVKQLADNGPGQVLAMFETELDVITDSMSNSQYGKGFSNIIRKLFHFEQISQMRKTGGELLVADLPKSSIILSGTPNQVKRLFKNNEDGMYSRFSVIQGNASAKWKSVKPDPNRPSLDDFFDNKANEFYDMWKFFQNRQVEVRFTDDQWDKINAFGERQLAVTHNFVDDLSGSLAKRHANMITRYAAILTMIRDYDHGNMATIAICHQEDFEIAMWMIEESLKSSIALYKTLPARKPALTSARKEILLRQLPTNFKLTDAKVQFPEIKERTLKRYLTDFVTTKLLEKPSHGEYRKTDLALLALAQLNENESDHE